MKNRIVAYFRNKKLERHFHSKLPRLVVKFNLVKKSYVRRIEERQMLDRIK